MAKFQPGQSGNPAGRPPKGQTIKDLITQMPRKRKRQVVETAYREAEKGDHHWAEWLAKHGGESAGSQLSITGADGGALQVVISRGSPDLGIGELPGETVDADYKELSDGTQQES